MYGGTYQLDSSKSQKYYKLQNQGIKTKTVFLKNFSALNFNKSKDENRLSLDSKESRFKMKKKGMSLSRKSNHIRKNNLNKSEFKFDSNTNSFDRTKLEK